MSDFDFSSSVSYDLSEFILICWFADQETFLIIITVENVLNEVQKPLGLYRDRIPWWIESSEKQYLFEIEIFCNIINVLTVIFYVIHPCQTKAFS